MGEVYRARDTTLDRIVALKILPSAFATDPERLARFEREARTLASLNHPHIAQIYGFEQSGGASALVMELVDGEDLSTRIARGPIPLDEALPLARQIAAALEAAHEQGIVHRDLKPANVKVRADGTVKVLDFGLAKAFDQAQASGVHLDQAHSQTITSLAMTMHGVILGTAAYMSPEQAKGKPLDKRTDIWAFGCVLYEMLSGRMAFSGESATDTLAKVIEREPDLTALPARVPPQVRGLIAQCLRKDPARRLRDVGDARLQLEDGAAVARLAPTPQSAGGVRWPWVSVLGLTALAAGWFAHRAPAAPPESAKVVQLDMLLPAGSELFTLSSAKLAITRDGSRVAFVAGGSGTRQLFVRPLDAPSATAVRGSESAFSADFAPDGQAVVFLQRDRTLKRMTLRDGLITELGAASGPNAPLWGADGFIVFSQEGLWRLPAAGGAPKRLTSLDQARGEVAHTAGDVLPSGVVLFTSWATGDRSLGSTEGDTSRIEAVDPATGGRRVVVDRASSPIRTSTGHLLFLRDDTVLAAPFDVTAGHVTGDATAVIQPGVVRESGGLPLMALSATGTLVYAPAQTGMVRLVRVGRDGSVRRLTETPQQYAQPRVSPDGSRLVVARGGESLWLEDLTRDARSPLTPGRLPGVSFPIWSRDGRRVVYRRFDYLQWVDADGSGRAGRITGGEPGDIPAAIAPDGDTIAVLRTSAGTGGDLFAVSMTAAWPARPLVRTPGYDGGADFSPDGRWLLYASTDSGPSQVYLSPYPSLDRKWPVSTGGGTQPRWSHSGREIYYRAGVQMMAVTLGGSDAVPVLSPPQALFERDFTSGGYITIANYDVLKDDSFVMVQPEPGAPRLTVILNWTEELKRLMTAAR